MSITPDIQGVLLLSICERKGKLQALDMPWQYRGSSLSVVNWDWKDAT
jgi:hypothetical protein